MATPVQVFVTPILYSGSRLVDGPSCGLDADIRCGWMPIVLESLSSEKTGLLCNSLGCTIANQRVEDDDRQIQMSGHLGSRSHL